MWEKYRSKKMTFLRLGLGLNRQIHAESYKDDRIGAHKAVLNIEHMYTDWGPVSLVQSYRSSSSSLGFEVRSYTDELFLTPLMSFSPGSGEIA